MNQDKEKVGTLARFLIWREGEEETEVGGGAFVSLCVCVWKRAKGNRDAATWQTITLVPSPHAHPHTHTHRIKSARRGCRWS